MPNLPMPEGLTNADLECVMLDVPPIDVRSLLPIDFKESDFFYGKGPDLKYAQGPVADTTAHVTLLFGIHPGEHYEQEVADVLSGWEPDDLYIPEASYFPSSVEGEDYNCMILKVTPTQNLLSANKRLSALPYTNRFTEYKPHITLAYVKGDVDIQRLVGHYNWNFARKMITPTQINLGLDT